jgi:hypothetical protein
MLSQEEGNITIRQYTHSDFDNNFKDLFYCVARNIEAHDDIPPEINVFTFSTTISERSVRDLYSDHQSTTLVWFLLLVEIIR